MSWRTSPPVRTNPKRELLQHLFEHHATWVLRRQPWTYTYHHLLRWHHDEHARSPLHHTHEEPHL